MPEKPFVSVIIPAWNGKDFIAACLDSVFAQDYPAFEVIVVDNASTDGTPELVADRYPNAKIVRNKQNLGFAGGVNVGIRTARGDVLVLFNQDAVAEEGWLSALVDGLTADPDIGIAGCKIYYADADRRIWHAGTDIVGERRQPVLRGDGEHDTGQYDRAEDVEAVVGAAMAIRRSVLDQVGLIDEDYFLYLEDTDLCLRARYAGYRVVYLPDAVARHHIAGSLKRNSTATLWHYHLSRLLFLLKRYETDWFCDRFVRAETEWLDSGLFYPAYSILRTVYLETMSGLIRKRPAYRAVQARWSNQEQAEVVKALCQLAQAAIDAMQQVCGLHLDGQDGEMGRWWQPKELPHVSQVPLLGAFVSLIDRFWGIIGIHWYAKRLMNQQVEINYRMVMAAEANQQLVRDLNLDVIKLQHEMALLVMQREREDEDRRALG